MMKRMNASYRRMESEKRNEIQMMNEKKSRQHYLIASMNVWAFGSSSDERYEMKKMKKWMMMENEQMKEETENVEEKEEQCLK